MNVHVQTCARHGYELAKTEPGIGPQAFLSLCPFTNRATVSRVSKLGNRCFQKYRTPVTSWQVVYQAVNSGLFQLVRNGFCPSTGLAKARVPLNHNETPSGSARMLTAQFPPRSVPGSFEG